MSFENENDLPENNSPISLNMSQQRATFTFTDSRGRNRTIFKYKKGKENKLFGDAYKREWIKRNLPIPQGAYFEGKIFNQKIGRFVKRSTYFRNDGQLRSKYRRQFLRRGLALSDGRIVVRPSRQIVQNLNLIGGASSQLNIQRALLTQTTRLELIDDAIFQNGQRIKKYRVAGTRDYNASTIFQKIIDTMVQGRKYRVFLSNGSHHKSSSWLTKAQFTLGLLYKVLNNVYQDLVLSDLEITVKSYPILTGGCYTPDPFLEGKTKVLTPKNEDDLCGQICIALTNMTPKFRERFGRGQHSKKKLAKEVAKVCKILGNGVLDVIDFKKLGAFHRVVILNKKFEAFYDTHAEENHGVENTKGYKTTYLFLSEIDGVMTQHYSLITNVNAFVNSNKNFKWCSKCMKRIQKKKFKAHCCQKPKCGRCCHEFESEEALQWHYEQDKNNPDRIWKHCSKCNVMCPNSECLSIHEAQCKGKKWKCYSELCCKTGNHQGRWCANSSEGRAEHVCGFKCGNCKVGFSSKKELGKHRCFLQKEVLKVPNLEDDIFVYDLESEFHGDKHVVNYAVVQKLYDEGFQETFTNINDLVQWMVKQKRAKFIAHNAKAYDAWLVRAQLIKTREYPKVLIMAGQKIMVMKYASLTWLDSLNHIAAPLSKLPTMFGMDTALVKKGYFPYKFNLPENQNYKGNIPALKYFEPDRMMAKKRKEFLAWWNDQKEGGIVYDFQKELREYCINDVFILRKALEIYQTNAKEANDGVDPLQCCTIASYCMKVFRTNHLPDVGAGIAVLKRDEYDFIRRAFFGGRTNATTFYKKFTNKEIKAGKCMRYKDVQSLYPSVQFFCNMPVGIPQHIEPPASNFGDDLHQFIKDTFGFIEVDITPPKGLYHPVLPERKDGRLIFDLLPKTRAVYSSVELLKAIEKGYVITKIYKALKFEKRNDIFKSYVRKLLKGKVEASGTKLEGEELEEFLMEHKKRFGIDLDRANLKRNEGYRSLMKIQLNSLWGKFGQSLDKSTNKYVSNAKDWFKILEMEKRGLIKKDSLDFHSIGSTSVLYVTYVDKKNNTRGLDMTSMAIAAMTTSHARLELYDQLDRLGDRVLYFDTDSVIYVDEKGEYNIPDGKYLREWECETKGQPIHEFVSIAPKSYGYKYRDAEGKLHVEVKFKGFTLNCENSKKINFNTLKAMVDGDTEKITTDNMRFEKDSKTGIITTTNMTKTATMNYMKRQRVGKYGTLPFGY